MVSAYALLTAVAAAGLLGLGWRLSRPRRRLRVTDRGLRHRDLGWGWIPWDEIEGAYPPSADQGETVRLKIRVTKRLAEALIRRRLPAIEDRTVEVKLDLTGTGLSAVELLQRIMARRVEARDTPSLAPRIRDA